MTITHVLFDLDGTLLDSEALYTEATELVCGRYGKSFTLELKRQIMGGNALDSARTVVDALSLPLSPEAYLQARDLELHRLIPSVRSMPFAEELIARLERDRVRYCIATSGGSEVTKQKLAHHPFLRDIPTIVCGDHARVLRGKPAPDIFLLAASELGAEPSACVVVEDTVNGVRAGVAAGMRTIAVIDPRFGFRPEQFVGAACCVTSLRELTPELLGLV